MHIVIAGASGLVGRHICESLAQHTEIERITALTRRPLVDMPSKTENLVFDMNPTKLSDLAINAEVFICALGTTIKKAGSRENFAAIDHELVSAFGKLAERVEARSLYVVSARGANEESRFFYNRIKGQMESEVTRLKIPAIHFLRPALLLGERDEKRFLEHLGAAIFRCLDPILPKNIGDLLATEVCDIAYYVFEHVDDLRPGRYVVREFR